MKARFRLTPRAQADLRSNGRYTEKTWGKNQRDDYLRAMDARFVWLSEHPGRGRPRSDVAKDYYCYAQGAHLIFYTICDGGIEIIGVPHQSMDVAHHVLRDDSAL